MSKTTSKLREAKGGVPNPKSQRVFAAVAPQKSVGIWDLGFDIAGSRKPEALLKARIKLA
jgi:hypothetical protein